MFPTVRAERSGDPRAPKSKRFDIEACLGAGGMGVVYQARDLERGTRVALKTLSKASAESILQLKREFRSLADLSHPNVVHLYELFAEEGEWFFTMELIDGRPFTESAWRQTGPLSDDRSGLRSLSNPDVSTDGSAESDFSVPSALSPSASAPTMGVGIVNGAPAGEMETLDIVGPTEVPPPMPTRKSPVVDFDRLRATLGQLATGIAAIHGAGKLHCDIKPSNVLVSEAGRVVVLDFGILTEVGATGSDLSPRGVPAGTPAYMAPEQVRGMPLTAETDWYALGILLFETLTGELPFEGEAVQVLIAKQRQQPDHPSTRVDGVPGDLDRLCFDLLNPEPSARPNGSQILRRLMTSSPRRLRRNLDDRRGPLIGRQPELDALAEASASASRNSQPVVIDLTGPSGIGKTALVQRFLRDVRREKGSLVLSGRCYERESVPYKAFDAVIDDLCRALLRKPSAEVTQLVGANGRAMSELALLFPVLRSVAAIDALDEGQGGDPHEQRRRAFRAMRELLARMQKQHPTVLISIDDAHWSDEESAELLWELVRPLPNSPAPAITWLLSRRAQDGDGPAGASGDRDEVKRLDIELAPLTDASAHQLAEHLLEDKQRAALIVDQAGGSPLLIEQLAQLPVGDATPLSPEAFVAHQLAELSAEQRATLQHIALAGQPVDQGVALRAAGIDPSDWSSVSALRVERLITTRRRPDGYGVETAREAVRKLALAAMSTDERKNGHLRLADALVETGRAEPEIVFGHYAAAGEDERAARFAESAAANARASLAFSRAASLFEAAVQRRTAPGAPLLEAWAESLELAGQGERAGEVYERAAQAEASPAGATELRRRAAEAFLKAGAEQAGLAALRRVLNEAGLRYPSSPARALATLLWHRGQERIRTLPSGLAQRLSDLAQRGQTAGAGSSTLDEHAALQSDVATSAALCLSLTDVIRGVAFGAESLTLARQSGDAWRIARALLLEASVVATEGPKSAQRTHALVQEAEAALRQSGRAGAPGYMRLARAYVPFFTGRWKDAFEELVAAETSLQRAIGVRWEINNARLMILNTLILRGELHDANGRTRELMETARRTGDRYALMQAAYASTVERICADDVSGARAAATAYVPRWTPDRYTISHWAALTAAVSAERYAGCGGRAHAHFESQWDALGGSNLMRVQTIRVFAWFERGLSALSASHGGGRAARRVARQALRALHREDALHAPSMALHLKACLASFDGTSATAVAEAFLEASDALRNVDLGYLSACAALRASDFGGGDARAEAARRRAEAYFSAQRVVSPRRCLLLTAPTADALC